MAYLRLRGPDGEESTFPLGDREVILGRQPGCDVVLASDVVSRKHARVFQAKDGWHIADLGSSHGTLVKGKRIKEQALAPGMEAVVGNWTVILEEGVAKAPSGVKVALEIDWGTDEATATSSHEPEVVERRKIDDNELFRMSRSVQGVDLRELVAPPKDQLAPERGLSDNPFVALVRIGDELHRASDAEAVTRTAVELAMRAAAADRGLLALKDPAKERYTPRAQLAQVRGVISPSNVAPSRTFIAKVLRLKEAMIARDADQDIDLREAKSIQALDIRSVVCVPMIEKEEVVGFLYLDKIGRGSFSARDLDLLCMIGYQTAAELGRLREQERRLSLSRFFSGDVVRLLEQEGGAATKAQVVTVLFSDLQGFTSLAEEEEPMELKKFLDVYFDRMTEILVDRHGGTLDKYIGDSIMALFGAPFSRGPETDARNAVAAAIDMIDALDGLRREFPKYGSLQMRIGVNSGKVVAGMMGSRRRLEYSVLGDTVNVASRLESTGEPGKIQIGETTHVAVKNHFRCEPAGERKMKNRAAPVKCYWVSRK
jgi:adenylate cyclase